MDKVFSKSVLFGLLFVVVFTTSIGGVVTANMMMDDGVMHDCPYMGVPVLCNMTPIEHVSAWQNMFLATSEQFSTYAFLLLLALAVLWQCIGYIFVPRYSQTFAPRHRYRERVFDPLRLAFARGIIHRKVF